MLALVPQEKLSLVFTFHYRACYVPMAKSGWGEGLHNLSVEQQLRAADQI
jgi:hypothetical protein